MNEINTEEEKLTELNDKIIQSKELIQNLKSEISGLDLEKEKQMAKLSELATLENNLQARISMHRSKIDNEEDTKDK